MYTNQRNISRVLAAAVASTGFAIAPMPAFAASLTCTAGSFSASAQGGNIVVSCTPPDNTTACSLTASPPSLPASGGNVTLTATNCGAVTSLAKNGNQVASSGTFSETIPPNAGTSSVTFTYTVQGSSGSDSAAVTESGTGTSNPPPDGPTTCDGYTVIPVDLPWAAAESKVTTKGFNNGAIIVARFTTPATGVVSGSAFLSTVENGDPKAMRTASLSTSPCDLAGTGTGKMWKGTQTPGFSYQINGTVSRLSDRVVLQPSTTYYFNIVNRNADGSKSCGSTTCNMILQLTKPTGL
jgi:hypothetical protein